MKSRRPIVLLLLLALLAVSAGAAVPTHNDVSYGPESRQFLDIYQAQATEPTPVYIWAHSNGSTANDVPNSIVNSMLAIGVTVISWESIETLSTLPETETSWADANLMFSWVQANASTYNLDTNNIIIGGASRGTGASWKLAHSLDPGIKGIYMKNALPDPFWAFPATWDPADDVSVNSPPIFFAYLPYPGQPGDIHDPERGMTIENRYQSLGIGDRMTLVHSLNQSSNSDPWQFLSDFVLSVIGNDPPPPPPPAADLAEDFEGSNTTYSWTEIGGSWSISSGAYVQGNSSAFGKAYAGDSSWTDYTFSADMTTLESFDPSTWMTALLAFRVSDTNNMYLVRLNEGGNLRLMSMVNGTRSTLASISTSYSPYDTHNYSVTTEGTSIKVSVDGELLIDVANSDHSVGYIGLRTDKSSGVFDNVDVTTAGAPEPISFSDDYNSGFNAGNYTIVNGNWEVSSTYQNLRNQDNSQTGIILTGPSDWADYTMTTRFKTYKQLTSGANEQVARVVFRYTDASNYYEAYVELDGDLMLRSHVNGVASTLLTEQTTVNPLVWNTMSIVANGSSITVSLNGTAFETIVNQDHSQGSAGFLTENCKGRFDDLVIEDN